MNRKNILNALIKNILICLFFGFYLYNVNSSSIMSNNKIEKSNVLPTGTIIIGTITNKEIIIAADSRAAFFETNDHSNEPIAYYDSVCKLFKFKQFVIGVSGASAIGKTYYHKIIDEYNKTSFFNISLENTLQNFKNYLYKRFPIETYPELKSNEFIVGGYVNGKPQLVGVLLSNDTTIKFDSGIIYTAKSENFLTYAKQNSNTNKSVYQKIEKSIYDYATGENKVFKIGGPISIISIKDGNQIEWIQNNFSDKNYDTLKDFYNAVKKDKAGMEYLVSDGKERLLKVIRH